MSGEGETYECFVCHGTFEKTRSDEEAHAEMDALWNETRDPAPVCDDCFSKVMEWARSDHPEILRWSV